MKKNEYMLISKEMIDDNLPIGIMYREGGRCAQDSGWRIMSGREGLMTLSNPNNTLIVMRDEAVKMLPEIEHFIGEKKWTVLKREKEELVNLGKDKKYVMTTTCRLAMKTLYISTPMGHGMVPTTDPDDMQGPFKSMKNGRK